jgi:Spy/CpxP family protein refolding chaperone
VFVYPNDMGKWWQNSDIVKQLQITDAQVSQLDQIFLDHRKRLIDNGAEMEKQDLKLQTLLDDDVPNEAQINAQVDQVLDARGKLEREYTTMNLDLRKVLSLAQWRQLKSIRGGSGDRFFFHKALPPLPPAPGVPGMMPLPPMEAPIAPPAPEPFE